MTPIACADHRNSPARPPRERGGETSAAVATRCRGEAPPNQQPLPLQAAIYETIHHERGLSKTLAEALSLPVSMVHDLADPLRRVPLKAFQIPALVRASNCTAILDYLEAQVGRVAFPLPSLPAHADEMQQELGRTVRRFGEFLQENASDLADGKIEPHELGPLVKAIDAMVAGLCEYRALVIDKAKQDAAA